MGSMDVNILSNDRKEAQAMRNWLYALPSFCVHLMAEPRLEAGSPHLTGGFSFLWQHIPSLLGIEYFFLINFSLTKEVIKVNLLLPNKRRD